MSLYTTVRHHRVHLRHHHGPACLHHEHIGLNGRIAAWTTRRAGSMWTVYGFVAFSAAWMILGSRDFFGFDPYPYPFLVFMGNVVQLLMIFIILLGQQVLGRAGDRRAAQTFEDAEAILHDCEQIQNHLIAQDEHLASCVVLDEAEKQLLSMAAERFVMPPSMKDHSVGVNGRFAAWITQRAGSMTAFYAAVLFQFGWMALAQAGVFGFDRYPFPFLLFLSSGAQLLLMFVIMVGQQVIGRTADRRSLMTFLDAEAVLHACERLQIHLRAQDVAIRRIVEHMHECSARPPEAVPEKAAP